MISVEGIDVSWFVGGVPPSGLRLDFGHEQWHSRDVLSVVNRVEREEDRSLEYRTRFLFSFFERLKKPGCIKQFFIAHTPLKLRSDSKGTKVPLGFDVMTDQLT